MVFSLYVIAAFVLSLELFFISSKVSFFNRKVDFKDFLKLFLSGIIISVVLYAGLYMGRLIGSLIPELSSWYAASIFFTLGLKLIYDAVKLAKSKQTINPLDKHGRMILTLFSSVNSMFIGVGFGMLSLNWMDSFYGMFVLFLGLLLGYIWGVKAKKLRGKHIEIIESLVFILIAVILISNS